MLLLLLSFPYINHVQCANILATSVFPSFSHQSVFRPIWRELSLKGHRVTVVTPSPLNDPSLTNLTEISISFLDDVWKQTKLEELLPSDANDFERVDYVFRLMAFMSEKAVNSTQFQKLISDRNEKFDLILVECHFPVLYALAERFGAPIACVSSFGSMSLLHGAIGNPNHPILYPDILLQNHGKKITFWQKINHFLFHIWVSHYHWNILLPREHRMAGKHFGTDIPYLGNLEKSLSMVHHYVNSLLYPVRPNIPTVLEINQVHLKNLKPLPKDLEKFLSKAEKGVIYFSLGSTIKTIELEEDVQKIIIDALSELPYKVIWKYESDYLPNKPPNVMIKKWLPQQDLLAHPKIRAFVTQGGLQSVEEAISKGVPLIGLPYIGDQFMNIERIVDLKMGLGFDLFTITKEKLKASIVEVAENSLYRERIKKFRNILQDKPRKSIDEILWWSEYLIRHGGAKHIRSPNADMSWFEFLMMDVVFIVIFATTVVGFVCHMIMKCIGTKKS